MPLAPAADYVPVASDGAQAAPPRPELHSTSAYQCSRSCGNLDRHLAMATARYPRMSLPFALCSMAAKTKVRVGKSLINKLTS